MILGAICARYHSQGLPGKAWKPMCGAPLIEHAIEKAYQTQCDEIVASHDIPRSVWSYAVPHIERPAELTGPEVPKWRVWQHLAERRPRATVLVDIDVTRPLTLPEDIDGCIRRLAEAMERGIEAVMAVAEADKHPAFDVLEHNPWGLRLYTKADYSARQQLPPVYYHGGVYAVTTDALRAHDSLWDCRIKGNEIPLDRARDIDTDTDWLIVEMLMERRVHPVA